MFLTRLKEYADERMSDVPLPRLYAHTPIAWIVELGEDGNPITPKPVSRIDESTARARRGLDMAAPEVQRSVGIKPLLMADNGEYTFGRARDPDKQDRVNRAHEAYLELLKRCAEQTREPSVAAIVQFFELGGAELLDLGEDWNSGLKITFQVTFTDGHRQRPIDLPAVQRFWLHENSPPSESVDQCLVCGQYKPVLERMKEKIKGIRGGQSSGTSLISANSNAFESYGLEKSRTSPTCQDCGEAVTRAANHLLANQNGRITVGDATFISWTRDDVQFDAGSYLNDPDPAQVQSLIDSVRRGRGDHVEDETAFYAAALSASGGRAVVRDWIDTTVGTVTKNVARWFVLQKITDPRAEDSTGLQQPRPFGLYQLAASTVRDTQRDLPVTTPRALIRSAFNGTPLPMDIAYQAIRRCRAEQQVTRARAALIKLVLLSQKTERGEEDFMVALEPDHPSTAYHCGRLLAVIEEIQRAALPRVNATIVDRFYGAASSTPGVVFGPLLRGAQPHLGTLRRDNPGAFIRLDQRLQDVMAHIGEWPTTLPLKEQALFSLGYYHQRAKSRAERETRRSQSGRDKAEETQSKTDQEETS